VIRYRVGHFVRAVLSSFWFWPLVFIAVAIRLSESIPAWASSIPVQGVNGLQLFADNAGVYAVAILTTTAAADITILTFVFSTLMIVLQLASSQLSPRILRPTLRQGAAQRSMGIMAGGFMFSVWSLLDIYGSQNALGAAMVVLVAIAWTFAVVITFLHFVNFTISNIRAPAVIRFIAEQTARSIRRTYQLDEKPEGTKAPDLDVSYTLKSHRDGIVTGIGASEVVDWAQRAGAVVELDIGLGDYVSRGVKIGRVRGAASRRLALKPWRFLIVERERTLRGDPPYGFRLLVDIANRALSPAINDPTTAVQVLDELQSLLVVLAQRPDKPGRMYDSDGVLRLSLPAVSWNKYLCVAIQEIYEYGHESSQVTQRIDRMLDDLTEVASESQMLAINELRRHTEVVRPFVS